MSYQAPEMSTNPVKGARVPTVVKSVGSRDRRRVRELEEAVLPEYVQFLLMMGLFIAILIGSYGFVIYAPGSPGRRQRQREVERQEEREANQGGS